MGLNQDNYTERTFINVVGGKFAERVKENTDGAIERVIENKDGSKKTIHEFYYKDLDAQIESVEIDEAGKFGDQLKINMQDVGSAFTVTLPMNGREAKSFLCCLQNIDLAWPITLAPYNFESKEDGKKIIGMNIYQGGKGKEFKVPPFFSKETPNGLPQVAEGSDKDEFKLTMKAQEIFLKKWCKEWILRQKQKVSEKPAEEKAVEENVKLEYKQDDLPF